MEIITTGKTASVGQSVSGVARIVLDPTTEGDNFRQGDILVAKITDVSYFSIMLRSAAMIGEIGGTTCHLASMARELNKVAVVGATDVTKLITDGELISVDGKTGEIWRLSP